ncbi:tellurite resistance TerB family protein [Thalassospira lucentensis]|uniref:tellurite resistance TerB family protein n=1 Tax=Thalassospira lucentensis TaxID=168935 RepID=UPI00142E69CA|nr:tellurite resistance TerB family protein [Thalassospira lucentensis]NIZ01603.1 tellurite resistance TerB family protein [Thalassospira lucentensis]
MDIGKLLGDVLGNSGGSGSNMSGKLDRIKGGLGQGVGGGLVGGALSGGLMSAVLGSKKGRKMGGKVLAYGGTALVAGLAYKAWRDYKSNTPPQDHSQDSDLNDVPSNSGFAPETERSRDDADFRLTLIRAMISAAKSDGHIDQTEQSRITKQIEALNLGPNEKAFLFDAFSSSADPMHIAKLAKTSEQGAEIYLASCLAIDADDPQEERYLERLGDCLALDMKLRQHLDHQASNARQNLLEHS